jgi:hypothetical protein
MKRPVLAIALFLSAIEAQAQPARDVRQGPARVRLSYRAAPGCPDESAFLAALTAQAGPFERAPRSSARIRSLDAEISRSDSEHVGLLRLREADGTTSERDVRGPTCAEVFSALALVTALAIDTGPPPPNPPPPDEPPPPQLPPPPPPLRWSWSTAVHAGAFFAMTPAPAWGVEPSVEASPPLRGAPLALRLGLALAASPRTGNEAGAADFSWFAARLDAALWPLSWGPVSLRPTAGVDIGFIRGRGFAIALPREQIRPWVDIAAGGRAQIRLIPRLGLELSGGLLVPITRPTWVFDNPQTIVHVTPSVGGYLSLGVRVILAD